MNQRNDGGQKLLRLVSPLASEYKPQFTTEESARSFPDIVIAELVRRTEPTDYEQFVDNVYDIFGNGAVRNMADSADMFGNTLIKKRAAKVHHLTVSFKYFEPLPPHREGLDDIIG